MSDPYESYPWWLRVLALWDGRRPSHWSGRVAYYLLLAFIFGPIPPLSAYVGWVLADFWGCVAGLSLGSVYVAYCLSGMAGTLIETGILVAIIYLCLLGFPVCSFLYQEAERIRTQQSQNATP